MDNSEQDEMRVPETPASGQISIDAKRAAARRRFLTRGAAAGSGALIVTLYHQRANAATIMTSSPEVCLSMHGTVQGSRQVTKANAPNAGTVVTATECLK